MKQLSLKKQTIMYAFGNYSRIIMTLFLNAILARILNADDYGIVAVITVFSTLFVTLSDVGVGPAIVQIKDLKMKEVEDIYSITVYLACALSVFFMILSVPISRFYNDGIYVPIGILLSVSIFFNISNMVPNGILNKEKKFVFIALRNILVCVASSVIAIMLALDGWGVYALVFQNIISAMLTYAVNYVAVKIKLSKKIEFDGIKKIAKFSGFQFAFNLVCYISRNLDNLLTGKYLSAGELGFYNKAYTLMLYPVNNLTGVFMPVLHPVLSDFQKEPLVIYNKFKKIARACMLVGSIVFATCYLGSREMIQIVLGSGWEKTAICFRWMSIAMVPQMMNSCVGAIYQSIGNTKLLFYNSCINVLISVLAILLGVFYFKSIIGLSICISIAYFFHFIAAHYMLMKFGFHVSFLRFLLELKKEIFILLTMALSCVLYGDSGNVNVFALINKVIYLMIIYGVMVLITREFRFILEIVKGKKNEKLD
ncbi:MAG: lipopolysaccharide biosynthesis protein [Lachnospiraceae bacterium]|nr:lipopolysaccharide biosynthesis protein [Lachnospiraceae bacterium]